LLNTLEKNRERAPRGQEMWRRFQAAMQQVGRRLADPADALHRQALDTLPVYTGYSAPMIRFMLGALALWDFDQLPSALNLQLTRQAMQDWQPMPGLPGRVQLFGMDGWLGRLSRMSEGRRKALPLFEPCPPPGLVVGYGAGNVPGTALLIASLVTATTLTGNALPVLIAKNSRREPVFAPLVLSALEEIDPDLVGTIAILIWDYGEQEIQDLLLSRADLVLAAASDQTIAQIGQSLARATTGQTARFHPHGHKVSFTAVGHEIVDSAGKQQADGQSLLDTVALLAALDSLFWDQNGCLSSRIHFVEVGRRGTEPANAASDAAQVYAARLTAQLRLLSAVLPRGAWPRQQLHDRFDRYKLLEATGKMQVFSAYDDDFVVAIDERGVEAAAFRASVNDCQGRVILIRPVAGLMDIPERYLSMLPAENLQSLSVATGAEGEGLTERFLRFATACGACGVTAIRTVGRGAFPQLAYSWDGLIPLDLVAVRPRGRFTTIEFDRPYDQMLETLRLFQAEGTRLLGQGAEV